MKTLYLIRHAAAHAAATGESDFERELTRGGKAEAKLMAQRLGALMEKSGIDLVLVSPARRAIQTAKLLCRAWGVPKKRIEIDERLYSNFSPADFIREILGDHDGFERLMVIGHNPDLNSLAGAFVPDFKRELAKCSIFACQADGLDSLAEGRGRMQFYEEPGQELEAYARLRSAIEKASMKTIAQLQRRLGLPRTKPEGLEKAAHRAALRLIRSSLKQTDSNP